MNCEGIRAGRGDVRAVQVPIFRRMTSGTTESLQVSGWTRTLAANTSAGSGKTAGATVLKAERFKRHAFGEEILKARIRSEFDVFRDGQNAGDPFLARLGREQEEPRAAESGIADRLDLYVPWQQSDAARAAEMKVVAEGAGQQQAASLAGHHSEARGHGAFGKLQLADVGLGKGNVFGQKDGAAREAAVRQQEAEIQSFGSGIDESAAADAARRAAADHVRHEAAIFHAH